MSFFVFFLLALFPLSPKALPMGIIDNGDTLIDQNNNLEWLDVSITTNLKYGQVTSLINDSVANNTGFVVDNINYGFGWRYASLNDLKNLLNPLETGSVDAWANGYWLKYSEAKELTETLGITSTAANYPPDLSTNHGTQQMYGALGMIDQSGFTPSAFTHMGHIQYWLPHQERLLKGVAAVDYDFTWWNFDSIRNASVGSFLVRDTLAVPAPQTPLLLLTGVILMLCIYRIGPFVRA